MLFPLHSKSKIFVIPVRFHLMFDLSVLLHKPQKNLIMEFLIFDELMCYN